MRRRSHLFAGVVLTVLLGLSTGHARAGAQGFVAETYGQPHQLVAVRGTRRLNLVCLGQGTPTVVFLSGLGSGTFDWRRVQPAVGRLTRACAYDRAGYGFSDPLDRPADADNARSDLHALLRATMPGRVILVGHSLGGLYATLYAEAYPKDLAGLVLVDPAFPGQTRAIARAVGPSAARKLAGWQAAQIAMQEECVVLARRGLLSTPAEAGSACLDNPANADPDVHREVNREAITAAYESAVESELRNANLADASGRTRDDLEAARTRASLGSLPVVVLTHGDGSGLPGLDAGQLAREAAAWKAGHDAIARLSSDGASIVVPQAGHFIQLDQPGIVIEQIARILAKARR